MSEGVGTILGVWAHPDDEAYLSAGVMAAARDAGHRVVTVTATKGELGNPDPDRLSAKQVAQIREREMVASLAELGVTEHHWLDYVDGSANRAAHDAAALRIAGLIEDVGPDTILTFGPDGMTGHADHVAVSGWTTTAWQLTGRRATLLYAAVSPQHMAEFDEFHTAFNVYAWGRPLEVELDDADFGLQLAGPHLDRKFRALRAQKSQTATLITTLGAERYKAWIAEEVFVAADRLVNAAAPN